MQHTLSKSYATRSANLSRDRIFQNSGMHMRATQCKAGFWRKLAPFGAAMVISTSPAIVCATEGGGEGGSPNADNDKQPPGFQYTHLWTSKDGETHICECEMKGFELKSFASGGAPQFVREAGMNPEKISFTQLQVGQVSPDHPCPGTQIVVDMKGSWYVKTTDGTKKVFKPGEILFQDNTEQNPADKTPKHESGVEGDEPCSQMVIQVDRKPETNRPCPF